MGHMGRRKGIRMVVDGKARTTAYVSIYTPVSIVGLANKKKRKQLRASHLRCYLVEYFILSNTYDSKLVLDKQFGRFTFPTPAKEPYCR